MFMAILITTLVILENINNLGQIEVENFLSFKNPKNFFT
jgi:hypothetical protein